MMTLDEAIKHCEEKAKEIRKANEEMPTDCKLSKGLCECANEHEQLAKWLKELKSFKEGEECMEEDAKQSSIPYTYNAPQHDWKCGYPDNTRGKKGAKNENS